MVSPVLLVGRGGQVASAVQRLAQALLQRPLVVVGRPELDFAFPGFAQQWVDVLEHHQPGLVINAAAYTAVDRAEAELETAMAVKVHAVGAMVRSCGQRGLLLLHLSTD
jgi:dTDP-4-dehydrorhamnose reductase